MAKRKKQDKADIEYHDTYNFTDNLDEQIDERTLQDNIKMIDESVNTNETQEPEPEPETGPDPEPGPETYTSNNFHAEEKQTEQPVIHEDNLEQKDELNMETQTQTQPEPNYTSAVKNSGKEINPIFVHTHFGKKTQQIEFVITATGQTGTTSASDGKMRLIYGRIYSIPINIDHNINSDNYSNMKIFSDMADKIDIRYITNGHAVIIPLQNNINLFDNTRLCVMW